MHFLALFPTNINSQVPPYCPPRSGQKSSQADTIDWAKVTLGINVSQSQISKWASNLFKHLDETQNLSLPTSTRHYKRDLYDLELALYSWMKHYETRVPITDQALRVKAGQLFNMMPMYQGQREPTWSNGWLEKFQKAHSIHKTRRYGEASSVSTINAEDEINSIREAL
ncbi:hypothetical protein K3495_g1375 [Podosphaera aphanis]|nr:hypothetical protein K3495_g1375 [Podosphaera aphanis]